MRTYTSRSKKQMTFARLQMIMLGILCVIGSFGLGIRSAGDLDSIASISAVSPTLTGDMDANGAVTVHDAILVLEVARHYREATPAQLLSDPNADGRLTVDDALTILHEVAMR